MDSETSKQISKGILEIEKAVGMQEVWQGRVGFSLRRFSLAWSRHLGETAKNFTWIRV